MERKEKLLVLIGPTAVGKTKLSIELAKQFNGEIISGDSMQIYKGMDIGTAKVTPGEMEGIPHHLIDIKFPEEPFSAAEFQELVRMKITEISKRGKLPMIVGGTGLYIQSVIYDYQFTEAASDSEFRKALEETAAEGGSEKLHAQLRKVDPESAERIHPNNIRRVIRALEVYHCTGKTMTEYQLEQVPELLYDTCIIGLTMERDLLYDRINHRVDLMMEQGLLEEVASLHQKGIRNCQSIQAIGYKELYDYLDDKVDLDVAVENLKQNSRRYAKRQLTWFRNKMNVEWFEMVPEKKVYEKKIAEISSFIEGKLNIKANSNT
ncbi:tRNA (adenosine(37)-N6)-dimethylallyltransferase MiaA [Mesobacillus foraminis]|uniref:tRNA (adenosine(37)-N6)-dimethylallyltransferase MiaA n=1 Tax=Mesobacillus foraminis TaxID=279826 RepID=UPI001BE702ED|nr:tRNA (adenosine(37)-N6)-dimethylallyltransferase MiaA [Mesobacillus foraminis]MBT2755926.1 tRNA (adenosine(37)-N6)-dimethylallyltransferase MiaA [Mesobacillus foraminis]